MAEQNRYNVGTLIIGNTSKPIVLAEMIYSDAERNPPKNIFKKLSIKDSDKNFHIPDEVDGYPCIGFEDQWARGYSIYGYYSMGKNVCFIPFHFFGIENDTNYNGAYIPSVYTNNGAKKWRLDFYKKEVLDRGIGNRTVRFTVQGKRWICSDTNTKGFSVSGFSLASYDTTFTKCMSILAGTGYNINRFHWTKETVAALDGWRPCFVPDDMEFPFVIEYNDAKHIYD